MKTVNRTSGLIMLVCGAMLVGSVTAAPDITPSDRRVERARSRKEEMRAQKTVYEQGKIFVKFKPSVATAQVKELNASLGGIVKRVFRLSGASVVRLPRGMSVEEAVRRYRASPYVEYAEPCYRKRLFGSAPPAEVLPNDPLFAEQWFHRNTGQTGKGTYYDPDITGIVGADIGSTWAWAKTTNGTEAVIAYIDTGADFSHPELHGNFWVNDGEIAGNGIDDDANGYVDDVNGWDFVGSVYDVNGEPVAPDNDPSDEDGHGTFGIGLIAAGGNNSFGGCGLLWNARIMVLKVADRYGDLSDEAILEAYEYAVHNGAQVINTSFGGYEFLQAEYDELAAANAAGVLLVASAGNDNVNHDRLPSYPSGYALPNIIAVAATNRQDALADFSNYGRTSVHLAAPGDGILSTLPNHDPNPYYNGNTADFADPVYDLDGNSHADHGYLAGTSFSAPLVCGALAMVKGEMPGLAPLELRQHIINSAQRVADLAPSSVASGGRLDVENAVSRSLYLQRVEPGRIFIRNANETFHLYGTGFIPGMSVAISGTGVSVLSVEVISAFEAIAEVAISNDAERSRRDIAVSSPDGQHVYTAKEILYLHGSPLTLEDAANVAIPDADFTGVTRTLVVQENRRIDDILVSIGITHTWIGDLVVRLQSPGGEYVYLVALPGYGWDSSDDILTTFPLELRPAESLNALKGANAKGNWTLSVRDLLTSDVGRLQFWKIMLFDDTISGFDFDGAARGWQPSQNIAPFTPPQHSVTAGGIALAATNNTNTFGFWQSPPDVLPFLADTLYRVDFKISTDVTAQSIVPGARLRVFSQDQQISYAAHLDSSGDGFFSPTPGGNTYSLYFRPPADLASELESEDDFNLAFDVLNFDPNDAAHGVLTLESVSVERTPVASLPAPTTLSHFDFLTGAEGWTTVSDSAVFSPPLFAQQNGALTLSPTNNTNTFGGWTSPEILSMDQKNLYRVRFKVYTNVASAVAVPQVRLRVHESALQIGSSLTVTSAGRANVVPSPYPAEYEVYISLPCAASGRYLLAAFDVLNFDSTDAATGTLSLDAVTVEKIPNLW